MGDPEGSPMSWGPGPRPPPEANTIEVVIRGPISSASVATLWEGVHPLLRTKEVQVVICDVASVEDPDAVTVDALARLQLTARRFGCRIRLRHACGRLRGLLDLMGLAEVVPCWPELPHPGGQFEQREPSRSVEEEADPGDPIA